MDFNLELEKLREQKRQCSEEARGIEEQKKLELKTIKKQIDEKYSTVKEEKYKELEEHNCRIDAYCQKLETYSRFQGREIGKIIASLVRTFEGTNYVYQGAYYYTTQVNSLAFDEESINVRKHPRIVVSLEYRADSYSEDRNSLDSIVKNGKAIILVDDAETLENGILFYCANTENHSLEQRVNFGRFSYVKEFIDGVISYRLEHDLKTISYDELEKLEVDFIAVRVEQIEENYAKLEQQQETQMKAKLATEKENRQVQLRKILDKKQD